MWGEITDSMKLSSSKLTFLIPNSVHGQNFIDYLSGDETNSKDAQDYSKQIGSLKIDVSKLLETIREDFTRNLFKIEH